MKWHEKLIIALTICFLAGASVYAYGISQSGREYPAISKMIEMINNCKGSWSVYASKVGSKIIWGRFKCEVKK